MEHKSFAVCGTACVRRDARIFIFMSKRFECQRRTGFDGVQTAFFSGISGRFLFYLVAIFKGFSTAQLSS